MMKKRIALLGLLGCMALCSERVQAVIISFGGQNYELSDVDYNRYTTVSRVRKTGGDTQEKADARVRELLAKLEDQIVKPSVAPTSTVAPKPTMAPPVPAAPTPEQIREAAARRAAAAMSATPVHATAASASAAQSSEMCCSGQHRMPSACACVPVTPQRGIMAQDALSAKRMAFSRMDPSDPRYAGLKAELDAASAAYADQLAQELADLAVDYDDQQFARRLQAEMDAELAKNMQSTSPALSTGSVTPPTVVVEEVVVVRPPDKQFREVMLVQPVGMSDEVWEMVKGGDMTIDEATEYLLVMAQAEREAAEAAANQAAIRSAEVELEDQAVNDLLKAERINLLIEKYQAYAAIRRDLLLGVSEVLDMVATEVALEAAERVALQAAFSETAEAVGLRVLREALAQ